MTDLNYTDELLRRLEQRAWPELANAEFLERLDNLAEEAHRRRTLDGSLAALLIYHQLVEDMTRVLVESARFFLQLSIFPLELRFKDPSKPMMGYWVQQLEETFDFDGKLEFTKRVKELNQLRNQLFHGITKQTSEEDIIKRIEPSEALYAEIYETFVGLTEWFALSYKDWRKDIDELREVLE